MPRIIAGVLKEYNWGVTDGLARWHAPTGRPQAELWFGTHASGPSPVVAGPDAGRSLADFREHGGMPLVKILAAASPLSIQVHPDARVAQQGWEAASPLYADDAEKAEVLVALEPFAIHAGWRPAAEAGDLLDRVGAPADAARAVRQGRPLDAAKALLELTAQERALIEAQLVEAARRSGWPEDAIASLDRVVATYPGDPGTVLTVLLDHAVLGPGDAVAVPAGVVHSYVGGRAIEVMTSSDNVLRLGLTAKTVAVDDALAAIHADREPERLSASRGVTVTPAGMPFDVCVVSASRDIPAGRHRLVLALDGDVRVSTGDGSVIDIPEGRAGVWAPAEPAFTVEPEGSAVVVTGDASP